MDMYTALRTGIALALVNFFIFGIAATRYGGVPSAPLLNPVPTEGPYFLDERGRLTEVTKQVFTLLMWQSRSVILLGAVGAICSWKLKHIQQN
jgi:hypothetical protein